MGVVDAGSQAAAVSWAAVAAAACFVVAAAGPAAIFFSRSSWAADLLAFFVPCFAVLGALAFAGATLLAVTNGSKPAVMALSIMTAAAALMLPPLSIHPAKVPPTLPGRTLKAMTFNVQGYNTGYDAVTGAIRSYDPDILVLQEAERPWRKHMDALGYPYGSKDEAPGRKTVEVLSRYPVTSATPVAYEAEEGLSVPVTGVRVELEVPDASGNPVAVVLYAIHPPTPRTYSGWLSRNSYLAHLARLVASEPGDARIVVAGDFNASPWSWHFRSFLIEAGLREPPSGWFGGRATRAFLRAGGTVFGSPVDHVVAGEGVRADSYGPFRAPGNSSDHDPVVVRLQFHPVD